MGLEFARHAVKSHNFAQSLRVIEEPVDRVGGELVKRVVVRREEGERSLPFEVVDKPCQVDALNERVKDFSFGQGVEKILGHGERTLYWTRSCKSRARPKAR